MTTILASWKSTLAGVLSFLTTTGVVLLATGNSILSPKVTVGITIGLALARAYMGLIEKDATALTSVDIAKQTQAAVAKAQPKP